MLASTELHTAGQAKNKKAVEAEDDEYSYSYSESEEDSC